MNTLNESFERVYETTFGLEVEEWFRHVQRTLIQYLSKFNKWLDNIDNLTLNYS